MIRTAILEDEPGCLSRLMAMLAELPELRVVVTAGSVEEGRKLLKDINAIDLIFSDVQLSDGLSFEIFRDLNLPVPVIFTTGYDSFITRSFDFNGIDYLLKPLEPAHLRKAVGKYLKLQKHFTGGQAIRDLSRQVLQQRRRIIVRKGIENILLQPEEIVLFFTENKVTYALTADGKKYLHDKNLSEVEQELDPNTFYRANRKFILNLDFIKAYRAHDRVKLLVSLTVPFAEPLIVSQENASSFKRWLSNDTA